MYGGDSMPLLLTFPERRGYASPHRAEEEARECQGHNPYWVSMEKAGQGGGNVIEGSPVGVMIAGSGAQALSLIVWYPALGDLGKYWFGK